MSSRRPVAVALRAAGLVSSTCSLAALALVAVAPGCGSDEAARDEGALTSKERFRSIWDFAYVYPDPETNDDVAAMLSIADLGIDDAMFGAMLGHAMGEVRLPDAAADDTTLRPDTTELTIFHEECLRDPARWRVSQVRFAPYEMGVPGTVSAYTKYAQDHGGGDFRRMMMVRLTLHDFCDANDFILREDQAFHLIYAVHPDDADLDAEVFASAEEFAAHQLAAKPNKPASYQALDRHLAALASPEYARFRQRVLEDWAKLGKLVAEGTSFAASDEEAQNFRDGLVSGFDDKFRFPEPDFSKPPPFHPGLAHDGPVRSGLAKLVKKYATPDKLLRVAAMFTEGGQDAEDFRWFFSQMTPGEYSELDSLGPDAERVYGFVTPGKLDTFVAGRGKNGVDVTRVTSAGYYSESRGVITGPKRLSVPKALRAEVNKVDYVDFPVAAKPEDGGLDGMAKIPTGKTLKSAMLRFTDIAVTNATTTPCDRCHNMDNIERHDSATGYRQSEQTADAYSFHAIAPGKLNLRTIREIDDELQRANEELAGNGKDD